jgi:DNA repair protein RadC
MNKLLIKDIPKEERPRERFIKYGVTSLSNEELIAIILKTGTKNISVKEISLKILKKYKDISNLNDININDLMKIDGIGEVKAMELISSIELGKRVCSYKKKISNSYDIYMYYRNLLNNKMQEYFYVLYLDNKKKIIENKLLYVGTINKSIAHPREIFKNAYLNSASFIVCVHNHPSGDPTPSKEDELITNNLIEIGKLNNIPILDHIIIGNKSYYSFFEERIYEEKI